MINILLVQYYKFHMLH